MMAVAIWRVLSRPGHQPGRQRAVAAYFVQLALNAAWSWGFFALHSPVLGLAIILALLVAIVTTIRLFAGIDRVAAWLLAPYLAWVAFASYLNAGIWWLNCRRGVPGPRAPHCAGRRARRASSARPRRSPRVPWRARADRRIRSSAGSRGRGNRAWPTMP